PAVRYTDMVIGSPFTMQTHKIIASLTAAAVMVPALSFAQATSTQDQVQALLSQIQSLQQQLRALIASSSPKGGDWKNASSTGPWMNGTSTPPGMSPGQMGKMMCIAFTRNLGIGSHGDDVRELQDLLGQDPDSGFMASSTGFFGPLTARAMIKFQ